MLMGTERLSMVATRGSADHHCLSPILYMLYDGEVLIGPPAHRIDASSRTAILLPAGQFIARRILSRHATWHEVRLGIGVSACAPFVVDWDAACRTEHAVAHGTSDVGFPLPDPLPEPWPCTLSVRRARLLIEKGQRVSIDELCECVRVPPHVLGRGFRRELGTTPHQYQIMVRLSQASHDLRRGVPPADAAIRAGFYDQSHLGRHMRRRLGLTPAAIAASYTQGSDVARAST